MHAESGCLAAYGTGSIQAGIQTSGFDSVGVVALGFVRWAY